MKIYMLDVASAAPIGEEDTREARLRAWENIKRLRRKYAELKGLLSNMGLEVLDFNSFKSLEEYPSIEDMVLCADVVISLGDSPSLGFSSEAGKFARKSGKVLQCFVPENERPSRDISVLGCIPDEVRYYTKLEDVGRTLAALAPQSV